jgi:hypothetical protein
MKLLKKLVPLGILLLIIYPITSVNAVGWTEDFSGALDEWDLQGYSFDDTWVNSVADTTIDSGFKIEDGALVGSYTFGLFTQQNGGNWSLASRESDVAFGSWNLDLYIEKHPSDQEFGFEIAFMYSDPQYNYNWTGLSQSETILSTTGYLLWVNNIDLSGEQIRMKLAKEGGNDRINLDEILFDVDFNKIHHINITRSLDYKFQVYFDGDLKLEAQESEESAITMSERFVFYNWQGKFTLDNLSVNEFTRSETTSNGFLFALTGLALLVLIITRRKRKNNLR